DPIVRYVVEAGPGSSGPKVYELDTRTGAVVLDAEWGRRDITRIVESEGRFGRYDPAQGGGEDSDGYQLYIGDGVAITGGPLARARKPFVFGKVVSIEGARRRRRTKGGRVRVETDLTYEDGEGNTRAIILERDAFNLSMTWPASTRPKEDVEKAWDGTGGRIPVCIGNAHLTHVAHHATVGVTVVHASATGLFVADGPNLARNLVRRGSELTTA
ncbi:MAG: hypothetical protein KAJ37_01390, partial [Candidatus Krumholzibacteria bacterium]|nr:hypothetical protein [Candidatus Krumholzibacteria bacterium]